MNHHIVLNENGLLLIALLSAVLPVLTGIITQRFAEGWLKALVLALLAAVTSVIIEISAAGSFDLGDVVLKTFTLFVGSVTMHYGLLKPTNVTGSGGVVQRALPGGVGKVRRNSRGQFSSKDTA